jgi:hypothetical protein
MLKRIKLYLYTIKCIYKKKVFIFFTQILKLYKTINSGFYIKFLKMINSK